MAMKKCKECGAEISSSAKKCPQCGKKQKHTGLIILAIIVLLAIVVAATSGDNSSTETATKVGSTDNSTSNSTSDSTNNEQSEFKIGDIVKTDKIQLTFSKANTNYKNYNSYSGPKSGNKVIRVEFAFENISDSDIVLDGFNCYADDEKCEEFYYADDYKNSALESLSAGKKTTAILYYEVPSKAKDIVLEYTDDFWSDRKVVFEVK